jgi:dihydroorotate dehydrogenase
MPDWSYRTVLRPVMLALGAERSRRLATSTLAGLSRLPFGLAAIDFLGHMGADARLRRRIAGMDLPGPLALGALIDPSGKAAAAFARFGAGLLEIGPVGERRSEVASEWRVDLDARTVASVSPEMIAGVDEVAANLSTASVGVPICIRIASGDAHAARRIAVRLQRYAAMFSVDPEYIAAVADLRPTLARVAASDDRSVDLAGAAGVWVHGGIEDVVIRVSSLRAALPRDAAIVAGGVTEPEDVRRLLEAGADVAAVDAGLVCSGPGLLKRCNEALLSATSTSTEAEPLTLDAARRAWFWALLLGVGMFGGGLLAIVIASTRVVLPYDESLSGMTRGQLMALNPRLLPFMAHDRVSLAGTMMSIGILYAALAWSGIRRGAHWAHVTVIVSAIVGFLTFFLFLGFGYFDPFHAFVTAILTQFTLLCMTMQPSPPQPLHGEWRETPAWRRGQWGQLLFVMIGVGLTGAGLVISFIGCTSVFVATDLAFLRTTATQLQASYEHLVPLVAHDRASLGGMLIANGVAVWLSAQWGFRAGARWLWVAFAWAGNIAFASAVTVHLVVGYHAGLHLAPALLGWIAWNMGLLLTRGWLTAPTLTTHARSILDTSAST